MTRARFFNILTIVLLIAAAAVFSYPYWSRWYAGQMQAELMQNYEQSSNAMTPQMREDMFQAALAYNERLAQGFLADEHGLAVNDPFTFAGVDEPTGYLDMLAIPGGFGIMATIELPRLGQKLPVYHGVEEHTLQIGIGHMPQTALPVGGAGTHSVLVGHRGLPASLLFTDLGRVSEGDQFLIHVLDHTLAYEVDSIQVVLPENIAVLAPQAGEDLMTLATCTPLGVNSHRLLIRGHRVPYATQEIVWPDANTKQLLIAIGICLLAAILIALRWWQKKRKEKRDQVSVKPVSSDPHPDRQI